MNGDMSNAELGISEVDAVGAKGRLAQYNSLAKQHSWSLNYLGERTLGYLIMLCVVVVTVAWMSDSSSLIRYGVTGLVVVFIAFSAVIAIRDKSALKEFRNNQVRNHAKAQ